MAKPLFSRSVRKHIRQEKARIRRGILDKKACQELIDKLMQQFLPKQKEEVKKAKPKKIVSKKPELAVAAKVK
ncbi:MAG: hypothetical protein Q8P12_00940 [bacterium]|nr:hypothetical protein [bacterium]